MHRNDQIAVLDWQHFLFWSSTKVAHKASMIHSGVHIVQIVAWYLVRFRELRDLHVLHQQLPVVHRNDQIAFRMEFF